ncbi:nucleolin 1-like [Arachis ipaensis]|uniref:nucleolin 1-like n=1 Tax=Arachis ipaensis TaxID=130454 RepID=UPI000A2AFAD4|nr:nucleolin 1-like [Arachis ipaensis]
MAERRLRRKLEVETGDVETESERTLVIRSNDGVIVAAELRISTNLSPVKVSKESSYSSDDSDEEEEKPSKTPQKSAKDVEMVDADSAKKVSKTPSTPSVATGGSKTLFVGNLSFSLQRSDFEEFFKDCGEVVDVRFSVDDTGRFKRFRHVEFAIAKAAQSALELNEHELLNHHVRLDLARERGSYILVAVSAIPSRKIRASLNEHFGSCREILRVSVPKDFKSGGPKCKLTPGVIYSFAYIDFKDFSSMKKALELNETELAGGYYLSVEDRVFIINLTVMVVDVEAYTYDNEVIKKAEAMGKPKNPEEEATVETTRAIKHHQES